MSQTTTQRANIWLCRCGCTIDFFFLSWFARYAIYLVLHSAGRLPCHIFSCMLTVSVDLGVMKCIQYYKSMKCKLTIYLILICGEVVVSGFLLECGGHWCTALYASIARLTWDKQQRLLNGQIFCENIKFDFEIVDFLFAVHWRLNSRE